MATIRTIPPSPRYPVERYRVLCKIDGRQVQYGVYSDPTEALRAKLQCETELAAGKDLALANQPLGYYIKYVWLPTYAASRNREKNVKFHLNKHILPGLGELTFKELHTLTPLARWKTGLVRAGYALSTIDSVLDVLSMILRRAVADGLLPHHPMCEPGTQRRWKDLRVQQPEPRPAYLTKPQADRLLEALAEPWKTFMLFLLFTGLRFGEATALDWRNLHRRPYYDGAVRGSALLRFVDTVEDPDRCRP